MKYISALLSLVFPKTCGGCGGYLVEGEKEVCLRCLCDLSRTGFHKEDDNDAEKLFWGKVKWSVPQPSAAFIREESHSNCCII